MLLRIRPEKQSHKLWTQSIPKSDKRVFEPSQADVATAIGVEPIEETSPSGQKTPETAELIEVYGTAAVGVEHSDHHLDCVRVEGGVVTVYEGALEFSFRELATAVFVDL